MKVVVELKVLVTVETINGAVDIDALRANVDAGIQRQHDNVGLTSDDDDAITKDFSVSFVRSKGG